MGKIISGLLGIGLLLQTYTADCASRKDLGIPQPEENQLMNRGMADELYLKLYDTDGDGELDLVEAYDAIEFAPGVQITKNKPFVIWYDRNKNGQLDDDEFYCSPGRNEDWERCPKKKFLYPRGVEI
jgi:hypothetical protein